MPSRQVKEVYVPRTDHPYGFDDIKRHYGLRMLQLPEGHTEPEITMNVTADEFLEKLVEIEYRMKHIQRIQKELSRTNHVQQKLVVIKELNHDQAKKMVENYIRNHGKADTEELMDLGIELKLLVGILDELKAEGKVKSVE